MKINAIGHLVKTNPIQTQLKPALSVFILSFVEVVEWANFKIPQSHQRSGKKKVSGTFPVSQLTETIFKVAFSRVFL